MMYLDRALQNWRARVARPWIRPGDAVLDVGCHRGEFLARLGDRIGSGVGLDPVAPATAARRYRLVPGSFGPGSPFAVASFDAVVMLATLEHILDKDPLAAECYRVLRPGGRVVITVPVPAVTGIVKALRGARLLNGMAIEEHHDYAPADTPLLFARHGFRLVHHAAFQLGLNHLFVFEKPGTAPPPRATPRSAGPGRPLRVVIVSHYALPHLGGIEIVVDHEMKALTEAGHRVTLITSAVGGDGPSRPPPAAAHVHRVPAWNGLERRFRLPYPIVSPALVPVLIRELRRCDVVHVHGAVYAHSVPALAIAWLYRRERILTEHTGVQRLESRVSTGLLRVAFATVGRASARLATRLVSLNARVTRLLERLAGTAAKTQFLPNPIDRSLFVTPSPEQRREARERLGWAPGRPKVLFVGRLTAGKGVTLLLRAADPAFDLAFLGPGDPSILGPLPRPGVEYLAPRPHREVVPVYHAADLLVLPSDLREGFPLVLQEALACGLPVLTSFDEGYAPYLGLSGLHFCAREPAAIRNAIRTILAGGRAAAGRPAAADFDRTFRSPEEWCRILLNGAAAPPGRATP